jgi:hypothetical protein
VSERPATDQSQAIHDIRLLAEGCLIDFNRWRWTPYQPLDSHVAVLIVKGGEQSRRDS